MRKFIIAAAAVVGLSVVPAGAAFAGPGGTHGYGSQPGADTSQDKTECAGHGSFGAFGEKGDFGHDFRGGADGQQTGENNSSLCGQTP
jgi:hypothetical protein